MTDPVGPPPRQLSTATERRAEVLRAAVGAFAPRGYYGTATTEIARAAGISQAYLYRLFPDKEALFAAVIDHVAAHLQGVFAQAGANAASDEPSAVLAEMSSAYQSLVGQRDALMLLMQANCAAGEPAIRVALRSCYAKQVEYVRAASGASDQQIQTFFAASLLFNTMSAIDAQDVDAPWSRTLLGAGPSAAGTDA